ncbi:MAG: ATP-binding cassette domain-containing protein, partial [Chitinophagaceae bacterium]
MIELIGVYKGFEDKPVLQDISAIMEAGKTNLIIGTSGSGKTVLMKCIVGLFEIDKGQILYNKTDFFAMTEKERKVIRQEIGMLFQGTALFDSMTV